MLPGPGARAAEAEQPHDGRRAQAQREKDSGLAEAAQTVPGFHQNLQGKSAAQAGQGQMQARGRGTSPRAPTAPGEEPAAPGEEPAAPGEEPAAPGEDPAAPGEEYGPPDKLGEEDGWRNHLPDP